MGRKSKGGKAPSSSARAAQYLSANALSTGTGYALSARHIRIRFYGSDVASEMVGSFGSILGALREPVAAQALTVRLQPRGDIQGRHDNMPE